ncbi:carboxyl transferase [Halioglobus sp.]|nr:carboxyl transferase [Halioglobus sp.]
MSTRKKGWENLISELRERTLAAENMGGSQKLGKQQDKGRLNARQRITALLDHDSFSEYGALAGGHHPGGLPPLAGDGLIGGTGRIHGRSVMLFAEDFTVKGGSIGHPNSAKRTRLVRLALEQKLPLVVMLDGAGERADNQSERYPNSPNDLQLVADLKGLVPVVAMVLGTSAGHGALAGMFADLIIMRQGTSLFSAGPPLVKAALGIDTSPNALGDARMHTQDSGVAHNLGVTEEECFAMTRHFLSLLPSRAGAILPVAENSAAARRTLKNLEKIIPPQPDIPYDMREVVREISDSQSLFELQPHFGSSIITALARVGGIPCMLIANQPAVQAGAITREAAEKATHFIEVASSFGLPLVSLLDNPGVMPGPKAEEAGTLKGAAQMFMAQRRYRGLKIVATLRKAFGFGSSVMGMNPWDQQVVSLALPCVSLGGIPAIGGAAAASTSDEEAAEMKSIQSGAWVPADAMAFDKVIEPGELRNEIITALQLRAEQ